MSEEKMQNKEDSMCEEVNTINEQDKDSLETVFAQLDEIIRILQNPQTSLEDSFSAYKEGMDKIKACNDMIDQVEKQVHILSEGGCIDEF